MKLFVVMASTILLALTVHIAEVWCFEDSRGLEDDANFQELARSPVFCRNKCLKEYIPTNCIEYCTKRGLWPPTTSLPP
uniref:Venom peptide HtC4Tx1 n=1 Tax=Hadogenes troglodytes TaxID=1577150 RepID=A0A1B3IJ02_9SCOR|nr:venom peptide HtC4Tx1 [Hadogenes troglodytes]